MTATVGIIGLGKIAETHLTALGHLATIEVVGGCDTSGPPTYWSELSGGAPFHRSLDSLLEAGADAYVVATRGASHAEVVRGVLARRPDALVFVEKPLTTALADAIELLRAPGTRVVPLYHAAYAAEVEWAASRLEDWVGRFGPVTTYLSYFSDPYDAGGEGQRPSDEGENSWLDSGVNALSVLRRLRLVDAVRNIAWRNDLHSTATVQATGPSGELGVVMTQWTVTSPSKSTTLQFADGSLAIVDHQATAGRVIVEGNNVAEVVGWSAETPRLVRHYVNLFQRELVDGRSVFTAADHEALLSMLLDPR